MNKIVVQPEYIDVMKILWKMHLFWVKNIYLLDPIIYRETFEVKDEQNIYLHIFCLKCL